MTETTVYLGDIELRDRIAALMAGNKRLSQSALARESGISTATLSQWLGGKYAGDNEAIDHKMRIWLEAHQARLAAGDQLPAAPGYVETPTATRVIGALGYAQMAGDIVVCYGAAGVGKTSAAARYQQSRPNVWIATMTPASSGVVTALEEICEALGVSEGGGARRMFRAVLKRVQGTHGLLVIDEAQHLGVPALDQIRSIHDASGVGIALVGNEGVYARMAGGRNAPALDRLYSRIGRRLGVQRPSDADIKALVQAWGISDAGCMQTLMDIARRPGALRGLTKTLRLASMGAAAEGRGVCCEDVRAAARELGSVA